MLLALEYNLMTKLPYVWSDPSITASCNRGGLISRSDMALHNQDWTENIMGKVSEWIDLDNSEVTIRWIGFLLHALSNLQVEWCCYFRHVFLLVKTMILLCSNNLDVIATAAMRFLFVHASGLYTILNVTEKDYFEGEGEKSYLYLYLSLSLSIYLSLYLSISICLSIYLSLCLSLSFSLSRFF